MAPLSIADLISAPEDPDLLNRHLQRLGVVPQAPPMALSSLVPPAKIEKQLTPVENAAAAAPAVKPMTPPSTSDQTLAREYQQNTDLGRELRKENPYLNSENTGTASPRAVAPMTPPKIAAPTENIAPLSPVSATPGAPAPAPGSSAYYAEQLRQLETPEAQKHRGILGTIGHGLARAGNIAADIVAPGLALNIPGSDMNKLARIGEARRNLIAAQNAEGENALRSAETENLRSEIGERERKAAESGATQSLVTDAQGNVTGWKSGDGKLHSLEEEGTPQAIKDIASETMNKQGPRFEKADNGDIVKLSTNKEGKTTSEVIYHGDPKVETDLVQRTIGGKEHHVLVNKKTGEDIKDLGAFKTEPSPAALMAKEKADEELVSGFTKDGVEKLVPRSQAEAEGLQHISKANEKERDDAKQNTAALNDMGAKVRNLLNSSKALDQGAYQKTLIQTALSGNPDDYRTRIAISMMSPESKEYTQDVFSLREAALALPKQTTGGSRVSEPQAKALWNTVPGTAGDSKYAVSQLRKFDENLARLWKKVPQIEGQTQERPFGEKTSAGGGEGTIKVGGQEIKLDADGTFMYKGHKYRPVPGSKKAELVE